MGEQTGKVDDTACAAGEGRHNLGLTIAEGLPGACSIGAAPSCQLQPKLYTSALGGQVLEAPNVPAMPDAGLDVPCRTVATTLHCCRYDPASLDSPDTGDFNPGPWCPCPVCFHIASGHRLRWRANRPPPLDQNPTQIESDPVCGSTTGKILGDVKYPFPDTSDFSSILVRAQASGAKVLGLCNAGGDTANCIKQAQEFGLMQSMRVVAMLIQSTDIKALGLATVGGLYYSESYYWDLNDRTRAWNERVRSKTVNGIWPNMTQAGNYGVTLHYLKADADMGVAAAKADGCAAVERMKKMPTDDDCFGPGRNREDGRALHPAYLFQAQTLAESKQPWDVAKVIATTPLEDAWRPLNEGGCPLVKA
jgi:hypothetical protein